MDAGPGAMIEKTHTEAISASDMAMALAPNEAKMTPYTIEADRPFRREN